ncbi:hypothetical protein [Kribbella sp. VKM Ac-2568]|uniref:hypothetical protein n=1 Tax=Kribbella sp. VKM Ac-2568 TaxID=2512219 RepID=UPI00104B301C|nr:hypothetical protein [Kribbella sp. VKM Ac-2568]
MNWSLRVPRRRWMVPVFLGVAALTLACAFMINVVDEYSDRSVLRARGQQITATVTEVLEYNRSNESLEVRVALPDGRLVDVDFAASNQLGTQVGQPVQVTIDPGDLLASMPTDQLNNGQSFASNLAVNSGPFALFAIGCFVFTFIRARESSRHDGT